MDIWDLESRFLATLEELLQERQKAKEALEKVDKKVSLECRWMGLTKGVSIDTVQAAVLLFDKYPL